MRLVGLFLCAFVGGMAVALAASPEMPYATKVQLLLAGILVSLLGIALLLLHIADEIRRSRLDNRRLHQRQTF